MKEFDYIGYLHMAMIPEGAIIDVSSDLLSIGLYCKIKKLMFNPDNLIDALKKIVGEDGTVLIRAFNWDFCKKKPYHINSTPSSVGSLGVMAMKRQDFRRTRHPMYSWFVWGKRQEDLCKYENIDGFGRGSIFEFFEDEGAVQLSVGRQKGPALTVGHYVEEKANVPYRKHKFFEADYYDENETCMRKRYSMFVRPLNVEIVNIFAEGDMRVKMEENKIWREYLYDDYLPISCIDLKEASTMIFKDIQENDGRMTMMANGVPGIVSCGIDWSTAKYW